MELNVVEKAEINIINPADWDHLPGHPADFGDS